MQLTTRSNGVPSLHPVFRTQLSRVSSRHFGDSPESDHGDCPTSRPAFARQAPVLFHRECRDTQVSLRMPSPTRLPDRKRNAGGGGKEGSGERKGALQKTRKSDSEIAIKFRKWDPVRFAFQSRFGRWQTILPLGGHRVSKLTLPPFRLRFPSGQTRVRTLPLVGPVRL